MSQSRVRLIVLSAVVTILVVGALTAIMRAVVSQSFQEFETVSTELTVDRLRFAINDQVDRLSVLVGDWGPWDETYDFLTEPDAEYIEGNLSASTLANLRVNGMLFFDEDKRLVHAVGYDMQQDELTGVSQVLVASVQRAPELFTFDSLSDTVGGVVDADGQYVLVASAPVSTSRLDAPLSGYLVAFKYLDEHLDAELSSYVRVPVHTGRRAYDDVSGDVAVRVASNEPATYMTPISETSMIGATTFPLLGQGEPMQATAIIRRTFFESGQRMKRYLSTIVILFGLAVGTMVGVAADRRLLKASRKEMEAMIDERDSELEASESRFRDLVENMADGLIAFEQSGIIVHANKEATRILSSNEQPLVGKSLEEVLGGEVVKEQPTDYGWWMEILVPQADGTTAAIEVVSAGIDAGLGQVLIRDVSARKRYEDQLVHLATHDHLTGLASRRRFEEELQREIDMALRAGTCGAVLWFDLDNFKDVNDSFGHRAGDELLVELAEFLQTNTRSYSTLSRFGGDEFALLLPKANAEESAKAARRLLRVLDEHRFDIEGHSIRMSACVGVSVFPEHGDTAQAVLMHADMAMYRAKEEGCGSFVAYNDLDAPAGVGMPTRLEWLERIKSAIEAGSFVVHAQPIADSTTDRIASYELLVRLPGEEPGQLHMPNEFMPAAERLGLVREIDRWMIRRAARLIAETDNLMDFEVNISGRAFSDIDLLDVIKDAIRENDIDPSRLGFEITETAAIADTTAARELGHGLRDLGCRLSLDDFGAGFSSLHYLRHLPVDRLKIDGDFIRSLDTSEQDRHLVRAMVEIARALGVETVAEFVENDETLQMVRWLGVDFAQGYAVGRPAPIEDVVAFVRNAPRQVTAT